MQLLVNELPLPYEGLLAERAATAIELVVVHCTETPDLATAREFGERVLYESGTGNSGHFYIDRDGTVQLWVQPTRIAHHVRGHNERSIGIELVHAGRWPDWYHSGRQDIETSYTDAQLASLEALLAKLETDFPSLRRIAGHEDLDRERVAASDDPSTMVWRKRDPGPTFPWARVEAATKLERWVPGAEASSIDP